MNKLRIITAIYDNGSTCSLASERLIRLLKPRLLARNTFLRSLNGVNFCTHRAQLQLKIGEIEEPLDVCVVKNDNFNYDLLLGLDAIQ